MTGGLSRRGFLETLSAGGALIASSSFAQSSWSIRGSEHGVLRLVFYTDTHARTEWETPTALATAARVINAQKADLIVCGGDLITGGFESTADTVAPRWAAYMAMVSAIEGEHHSVIGNHDLVEARPDNNSVPAEDPRMDYKRHLGLSRTYNSFDALGYHFILLDSLRVTPDEYMYHGWVSAEQREWIKEELSRIPFGTPVVVVIHIPLLTGFFSATKGATFQAEPNRVVVNNVEVLDLFAEHNLVLVLQGHLHVTELLRWRGTTFVTGGAVSAGWWRGRYFGTEEGFGVITLRPDRVEWHYVDYGWDARRPKGK